MTRLLKFTFAPLVALVVALTASQLYALTVECYYYSEETGYVCGTANTAPQTAAFATPKVPTNSPLPQARYVRLADFADIYAEPSRSAAVVRNAGDGYLFASIATVHNVNGEIWYEINPGEFLPAASGTLASPSTFQGVEVLRQPERPFGWIVGRKDIIPSREPAGEPDPLFAPLHRYDFFEVYEASVDAEGWVWYNIGDGRWIKQTEVSLVDVSPRPEGVGENEFWSEVDLYEQSFAAYEGDRMVYATLISSGLNRWPTREGLFQVFESYKKTKMSGAEGKVDYYFVEDVPYTMYFDEVMEIALHGAYWHDRFGYKHSHGCVNMPPLDSEWVFNWAAGAPTALWVNVYTSDPLHYFDRQDPVTSFTGP